MSLQPRTVLFGRRRATEWRYTPLALAVAVFAATFATYALSVVELSGGVVFVAFHAAVIGMGGATWAGYRRRGLVAAWLITYAALLGQSADLYLLGQPPAQSFVDRTVEFVQPDGLVFLGVEAVVLGTLAFLFGALCGFGKAVLEERTSFTE